MWLWFDFPTWVLRCQGKQEYGEYFAIIQETSTYTLANTIKVCAFSVVWIFASTCTKTPWVQHLLGKQEPTTWLSFQVHAHHPHHSFEMFLLLLLVASQLACIGIFELAMLWNLSCVHSHIKKWCWLYAFFGEQLPQKIAKPLYMADFSSSMLAMLGMLQSCLSSFLNQAHGSSAWYILLLWKKKE